MESINELQYENRLLVLENTVSNDVLPENRSVIHDMLNKETNSKVPGDLKFQEVLSPTTLSGSSGANEIAQSCNSQSASESAHEVSSPTTKFNLQGCIYFISERRAPLTFTSIDAPNDFLCI